MVAALLADLFESHRAHLLSVAYRLTGSVGDAEDAVQESWLRLGGVHQSEIDELRAWLTARVAEICLDRLRSATARRESYVGQWLPEPIVTEVAPSGPSGPLALATRGPECRLAAMVVLDTMTPAQRVAHILGDGLDFPEAEIAAILGVSVDEAGELGAAARTLAASAPPPVSDAEHEAAVRGLLVAVSTGDPAAAVAALHPQAHLLGDAGGTTPTARVGVRGAERIVRLLCGVAERYGSGPEVDPAHRYEIARVNGQFGFVVKGDPGEFGLGGWPARVLGFAVRDGLVWGIYDLANPAKLSGIRLR
ncbi:RNA polymerase sigma factor SigJ [Nocardia panacis]|uniref:RNA polymerase sigma factor SigJ n=1 Tax=Nocardia panacis TaxID=2340916 RepID=A0A3A4KUG6_9NOCA|nr:RNA polymerase sigma factor SigJ [Nocardia panacis]RJO78781.1 RNA polymerase sigma factor SigJ [Nocardia panacis]